MQLTDEVNWTFRDFAIMGVLLYGTGLLCELVMRMVKSVPNRILICAALVLGFLLIWVELAVGIFGTPFDGPWRDKLSRAGGLKHDSVELNPYGSAMVLTLICFRQAPE